MSRSAPAQAHRGYASQSFVNLAELERVFGLDRTAISAKLKELGKKISGSAFAVPFDDACELADDLMPLPSGEHVRAYTLAHGSGVRIEVAMAALTYLDVDATSAWSIVDPSDAMRLQQLLLMEEVVARSEVMASYRGSQYELIWPRDLFVIEAQNILDQLNAPAQYCADEAELEACILLQEAFAMRDPVEHFRSTKTSGISEAEWLEMLIDAVSHPGRVRSRAPYWTVRTGLLDSGEFASRFIELVAELDVSGYFESAFPHSCLQDYDYSEWSDEEWEEEESNARRRRNEDASRILCGLVGMPGLWPLDKSRDRWTGQKSSEGRMYDVVEALHDLVVRPRVRKDGCSQARWHCSNFTIDSGRQLYRWKVNQLLAGSVIPYRLAGEEGDVGRLIPIPESVRCDPPN